MSQKLRRQNWVDSQVQGTLVRRILFHWCAFFLVTLLCVSIMHLLLGDPNQSISQRFAAPGSSLVLIGVIMLALFPTFALDTIRFSNRFVGPIARLRRSMRELAAGESVKSLAFRDNDFWADVADEFNSVARIVNEQSREIEALKEQLADRAEVGTRQG